MDVDGAVAHFASEFGALAVPVQTVKEMAALSSDGKSKSANFKLKDAGKGWKVETWEPTWFAFDGEPLSCAKAPTFAGSDAPEVLAELGIEDENLEIAKRLEEIALKDEYFIDKKLYPNVDFYSGIILKALGIPTSMFTVIFAIGRTVGWIAHWNEMIGGAYRIGRPRQLYTGETQRDFIPLDKR